MTDEELIKKIEKLKNLMISVSTGGPGVNEVNAEYKRVYSEVQIVQRRVVSGLDLIHTINLILEYEVAKNSICTMSRPDTEY